MSVAFRRESDEEHLEPKFAVPIPPGPNRVTPAGLALIEARVAAFEARVAAATEETDRVAAKRDLAYWLERRATAEVQPAASGTRVEFGCRVRFSLIGAERTVEIVGHDEADPAQGRIAFTAPLAQALTDAEVGEFVDFNGREDAIEVLAVEAI